MASVTGVTSGLAMAVVLAVGACSTPPRTAATHVMPPVAARILPMFQGNIVFDVNQPSYVAVFDVRPFIGVEMIYPGPNDDGRAVGGVQAVGVYYLTQADDERRAMLTPPVGGGEEYLYLVASRTPLNLGDFAVHPIALNDYSHTWERGLPPYEQIDSLMRNVVKPLYDNDWDADVLILMPPGSGDPTVESTALACGGGTAVDPKLCRHSDRTVPTVLVASDALNRNLAVHYAPSGVTRGGASASPSQWGGAAEHDGLHRANTSRAVTTSSTDASGGTGLGSGVGTGTATGIGTASMMPATMQGGAHAATVATSGKP